MSNLIERTTLDLNDVQAQQVSVCGGKGANLAKLTAAGFTVPNARVVCVKVYQAWFAQLSSSLDSNLVDRSSGKPPIGMANGLSTGLAIETADTLAEQCSGLREQLAKVALPLAIEAALREELSEICKQGPVSVRSSATLEDMQGAAFAGQHETYLGVVGIDDVLIRIVDCYVSLWADRAVRYRFEQGFNTDDISMAVVVQRMVKATCAGVAFSAHPINGKIDQVLINSAFGLGETVVSGDGEIGQYTVDREGVIIERHIGNKENALLLVGSEAVITPLCVSEQVRSSLSDALIRNVASLAKQAELHFGFPQDIEWAVDDHGLHLLQSRPISELPARWTRQESAERFPGPVTPLTWDFTTRGFHESLRYSLNMMGLPEFNGHWFERFNGFVYGNQTAVELYTTGQQIEFHTLDELASRVDEFREKFTWVQQLPSVWGSNLDRFLLQLGALDSQDLAGSSKTELWEFINKLEQAGNEYFLPNIAISITQGLLHRSLYKLVVLVCGERAPIVYDDLTCFCDTKTAQVNRELFYLHRLVAEQPKLQALLLATDRRKLYLSGDIDQYAEFSMAFTRFIADHGHREVEFDAYHPTWSKQPWIVLENLRLMSLQDSMTSPVVRDTQLRSRQHRSELKFLAMLPESLKGFAKELIHLSRVYTGLDDLEHYHTTRLSVPFRTAVLALGDRFVASGFIEESDDLFFLSRDAVDDLVLGDANQSELALIIKKSKQQFVQQQSVEPPFELGENISLDKAELNDALTGLPGAPSIAHGKTCVIRSSDDFASFVPGAVLVARTTNPAWTPLFYAASAVITESGGPLSHGAVTAREIGIPAVVAARGAIGALGDDQHVLVNGGEGEVVLLD